ncbi:hypothetical protein ACU683_21645 [Pseudomonas salmasensis]
MNHRTFSELRIPSTLPVEITSDQCGTRFESEQLYRLCLPSNASSSMLMRRKGGELDNMLTTVLRGPEGIVGSAGLKPVAVSSISPLITLQHLHAVSACIQSLTDDLGRLQKTWQKDFHADLESAISNLADIAPRIDIAALDESYRTTLLVSVRATKNLLSACLERELTEFDQHVVQQCDQLNNYLRGAQFSSGFITSIAHLGESKVFSILGFLAICELFEIILFGVFSKDLMQASYSTLTRHRDKVLKVANKYYEAVVSGIEQLDTQMSWCDAGRNWHLSKIKEHSENISKARDGFELLKKPPALLDAFLNGDATKVEEFWFYVRDDRVGIFPGEQLSSSVAEVFISPD